MTGKRVGQIILGLCILGGCVWLYRQGERRVKADPLLTPPSIPMKVSLKIHKTPDGKVRIIKEPVDLKIESKPVNSVRPLPFKTYRENTK